MPHEGVPISCEVIECRTSMSEGRMGIPRLDVIETSTKPWRLEEGGRLDIARRDGSCSSPSLKERKTV